MNKQTKGSAANTPSKPNTFIIADGKNKGLDRFKYTRNSNNFQCKYCSSDYQRFAVNGVCQDCQQRVEFIIRERPHILQKVRNQESRQGVTV